MKKTPLILLFILSITFCFGSKTISLTDSTDEIWVTREYVDYLIDTSNRFTINDILKTDLSKFISESKSIVNNNPNASYWIHFKVESNAIAQSFRVELFDFDIDEIEFFTIDENGNISSEKAGYQYPFNYRKIEHKNPGFNISIPENHTSVFYIRFKSKRNNSFKPVIRSYEKTLDYGLKEYILLGIFYGLLLLMIFYNLLYFIILQKRHYLFYVLYASSILIYLMNRNGTAFQYLWPNNPELNIYMDDILLFVGSTSMLFFTIFFLDLKNTNLQLRNYILIAIGIRVLVLFVELISSFPFPWILIDTAYIQIAFFAGIKLCRGKVVKSAKWFVIAFAAFNLSFLIFTLEIVGWIPSGILTVYSLNIGIILQFVFLSISIAESVKETYIQKNNVQAELLSFQEKQTEKLEHKVKIRTVELEHQKELVEEKNNHIMASVRYAKTIQTATLPNAPLLRQVNPNHFILFMPRDIVSGDFYWTYQINEDDYLIAAADCTGHGIPGAFMSMIGVNLLNRIVSEGYYMPNDILSNLHTNIQTVLNQKESNNSDGMDIAICRVNKKEKEIHFSGAKNPLIYVMNNEVHKIKATRKSIGGCEQEENLLFDCHPISYKDAPIHLYLFSDGYADQFGGPEDRKYYLNTMIDTFLKTHHKPMGKQKTLLKENIIAWKGKQEQIDDILIIGIKEE